MKPGYNEQRQRFNMYNCASENNVTAEKKVSHAENLNKILQFMFACATPLGFFLHPVYVSSVCFRVLK